MSDIYGDPELQQENDYPDQVRFEQVHDRVRGEILKIEKINTRFGPTVKYSLLAGDKEVTMLAGSKNLWGQLLQLKPEPGDVLDITLVELRSTAQGTAKLFDIKVERSGSQQRTVAAVEREPRGTSDEDIFGDS